MSELKVHSGSLPHRGEALIEADDELMQDIEELVTSRFISINISGFIGSATPLLSKRLGFDPAVTAGPFETAFQDVIGTTVFLTIATLMLQWL